MEASDAFADNSDDAFGGGDFGDFGDDTRVTAVDQPTEPVTPDPSFDDVPMMSPSEPDEVPVEMPAEPEVPVEVPAVAEASSAPAVPVGTPPASPEPDGFEDAQVVAEDAPEPEEKGKKRKYFVLKIVDAGRFEQVTWREDKNGKMVPKGTPGGRKQGIALAAGPDEAIKIAHAALGSPTEAVRLVAVAELHFKLRTVKPTPIEPVKVQLSIQ